MRERIVVISQVPSPSLWADGRSGPNLDRHQRPRFGISGVGAIGTLAFTGGGGGRDGS
jgi:hypothetical protein